ncbi:MAG TPA: glycosyltransferase family 2 protein [Candidatus Kapabacteria bacterium]|nr:glycosyltransferase family 2 protein [Candidatus Kapabacteria bacterium]
MQTAALSNEQSVEEAPTSALELSIVMPCLNEADTVGICIQKALLSMQQAGINGEIVIADNGSTDRSVEIARKEGARVVSILQKGYGNALMGGIAAARGKFIIMGDADDSYDFLQIPRFVEKLREGYDLVQGCRLPSGGGEVLPGAMPLLHRWWGNPMFTFLSRWWFRVPVDDIYSGFRGFTKELYTKLDQRCTGMEFATEMIIKASLNNSKITQVPITLHPDGRKAHAPHLKTFRDGWRTLRFYMLYTPRWLFLVPGSILMMMGLVGYAIALPGLTFNKVTFDAHTLIFSSLFFLAGYQVAQFAIFTKTFAIREGLLPADRRIEKFLRILTLERGLILSLCGLLGGLLLLALAINRWRLVQFGALDYAETMRLVVPGATLTTVAIQTFFSSFVLSLLTLGRR